MPPLLLFLSLNLLVPPPRKPIHLYPPVSDGVSNHQQHSHASMSCAVLYIYISIARKSFLHFFYLQHTAANALLSVTDLPATQFTIQLGFVKIPKLLPSSAPQNSQLYVTGRFANRHGPFWKNTDNVFTVLYIKISQFLIRITMPPHQYIWQSSKWCESSGGD